MVRIIPQDRKWDEFNGSSGERILYDKFSNLSDEWYIFHSVKWSRICYRKRNDSEVFRQSESDFVIFNPNYGILTLEVKSGGYILKNGRLNQINRSTGEIVSTKNPMDQADSSKFAFLEIINNSFPNYSDRYQVNSMVWLTDIDISDIEGDFPNNYHIGSNTFLHSDLDDIEEALLECFRFYKMEKKTIDNNLIKKTISIIAPEFKAIPSLTTQFSEQEYFINTMTRQQSYLIDYLEEQKIAAIQGSAGTGKTILAVEKARRLSESEKVVYLCFNSMLVDFLKEKYQLEMPNVEFTSLYRLAAKAFQTQMVDESVVANFLNNIEEYPEIWSFDSVIIDEGQDFSNEQIRSIKEFQYLTKEKGSFYVFYDKNQLVQQRLAMEWLDDIDCRLVLSMNCRNPLSIAKTSGSPIGLTEIKTKLPFEGEKPEMHISNNLKETTQWISDKIRELTEEGIEKKRITILSVKGERSSLYYNVKKIGSYSVSDKKEKGKILLTTARKFKGLESDVVFLVDVDYETFEDEEQKRLFYVGASRAKHKLVIVSTVKNEEEQRMIWAITNGKSSKRIRITSVLKVTLR